MKEIIKNEDGVVIKVRTINNEPSMTRQEFKDELDRNNIINKYIPYNQLPDPRNQVYADLSDLPDFLEAAQTVAKAEQAFASLPSNLRTRFQNDPTKLLAFVQDKSNYDEGVKLGLFEPPQPTPTPQPSPQPTPTPTPKSEA
jgi:phage internal scaffolding protein